MRLQESPKSRGREPDVSSVPGQSGSLLYVQDSHNNLRWLVDSGALYSIVPPTYAQRCKGPTGANLQAAKGTKIACYGTTEKTLMIGNKNSSSNF